jgi:hypothetical protein
MPIPKLVSGFVQLDVGVEPRASNWIARLALATELPTVQSSTIDRVRRRPASARFELGRRFRSPSWWFQPALGAGVVLSSVTALDLPGEPSLLRLHPEAVLTLGLGYPVAPTFALRLEIGGTLLLDRDHYLIEPQGEVALSPRATITAGLGAEFFSKL